MIIITIMTVTMAVTWIVVVVVVVRLPFASPVEHHLLPSTDALGFVSASFLEAAGEVSKRLPSPLVAVVITVADESSANRSTGRSS